METGSVNGSEGGMFSSVPQAVLLDPGEVPGKHSWVPRHPFPHKE